jgi:hypothetical protein
MTILQRIAKSYYTNLLSTLKEISIANNTFPKLRVYFELADSSLEAYPYYPAMLQFSIGRIEDDLNN